jgi:hypothetical protein
VIALDAAIVGAGFGLVRAPRYVLVVVVAHVALSAAYGAVVRRSLLQTGREATIHVFALAMSVALLIPALGPLALVLAFDALMRLKPKVEEVQFQRYAPPPALERRPPTELRPRIVAERLVHLVRHGRSIETRFSAVLHSNEAPAVVAVPVLKAALSDAAEEVRLSAFSQLEKTRRSIDLRIERARERLEQQLSPSDAQSIHAGLAQDYYEIAYLGLAEGEVYKHALKQALTHARASLEIAPDDAPTLRLVGRIRLRQASPEDPAADAKEAFDAAAAAGMPLSELAADYAEEAFGRRAWDEVARVLAGMRDVAHDHVLLARLQEFWRWP